VCFGCEKVTVTVDRCIISKKEKWKGAICRFQSFESRNNSNFFGDIPLNQMMTTNDTPSSQRLVLPPIIIPSSLEDFDWTEEIQGKIPRPYQYQAFIESSLQDLVLVMPTGTGKTFVAIMLIARLRAMNPRRLAVFVVDRIPLVYQQASAIHTYTNGQVRVCELCSENKTKRMVSRLNDNTYDVLVVTGGSLYELINNHQLRVEDFCVLVLDECHHCKGTYLHFFTITTSILFYITLLFFLIFDTKEIMCTLNLCKWFLVAQKGVDPVCLVLQPLHFQLQATQ
jgi:hypothetical protein